jgi:hypothetical protein
MRKMLLSHLFVFFILTPALAQLDFRVKAANIILTNGESPTELIIENSTKHIKGVLVNRGNGLTEFRQIQRLNDSTFVIGYDTLTFRGTAQDLQQVTNVGKTTTHYINADGGYYQRNIPLLVATDSLLRLGYHAGESNTTGGGNTAAGNGALQNNTTGSNNTAAGYHVLQQNTTGYNNVAIGVTALMANSSGSGNVALGRDALISNTTGSNNVGVGTSALGANSTGSENTAIGYQAAVNYTGNDITAIGGNALANNTTGQFNTALGQSALNYNVTGSQNTAVGSGVLYNISGNDNTAVGKGAGSVTSASGSETLRNTAVGSGALGNVNGNQNTAVGADALGTNSGFNNTAVGDSALYAANTGALNNTAIGKNAGANIANGINNIAIGSLAYVPGANDSAQLSIGNLLYGTGVNGIENTISNGKVGIKTKTPAYELDVNGKLGVRTMDSISATTNMLCQDPITGEIKKAAFSKPQSFIQTATTVVNATDAETTLIGAGTGSLVIPASAWFAGKSFRIVVRGGYSTDSNNPAYLSFTIKLGTTIIAQTGGMYVGAGKIDVPYVIRADLTCRSTGASGSVLAMGLLRSTSGFVNTIDNGASAATVNLSVNQTLNITARLNDDSAGNSISAYIVTVEAIN